MSQVTLTWAVNNMTRVLDDGFVIKVDWSCTASATGVQGAFHGGQDTYANDPSEPGFTPYDQLTEAQVLNWVWTAMGADEKAAIEATLQSKVEKQLAPTIAQGLPWATAPTESA